MSDLGVAYSIRQARIKHAKPRRDPLRVYARALFDQVRSGEVNHLEAFARVVDFAAALLCDFPKWPQFSSGGQADALTDDLQALFVGEGLTRRGGRFTGDHYVELSGSTGFKPQFQEEGNQIMHATAGIVL